MTHEETRKVIKTRQLTGDAQDLDISLLDEEYLFIRKRRQALVIVAILLIALLAGLLFALFSLVKPLDTTSVESATGSMGWQQSIYGTGTEVLYAPTSVAVGSSGEIYVAEPQRSRVLVFDADGGFEREIRGVKEDGSSPEASSTVAPPSPGATVRYIAMQRPESLFVDDRGMLYIADPLLEKVLILDPNDELVRTIDLGEPARGVGTSETEIFVLGEGRVYVYAKGGGSSPLRWFGGRGNYPGEIRAYQGIEVAGDVVYIADASNHRIEAFSTQGDFLWSNPEGIASSETTAGVWDLPQDLTVDDAGHLVIVDALRFELSQASAADGAFIDTWGDYGAGNAQFAYPSSVAYDAGRDRFIVADTKNGRVQILTLPNSSEGLKNATKTLRTSPWRYILVPIFGVLVVGLLGFIVYRIYRARKRRGDEDEFDSTLDTKSHDDTLAIEQPEGSVTRD